MFKPVILIRNYNFNVQLVIIMFKTPILKLKLVTFLLKLAIFMFKLVILVRNSNINVTACNL